MGLIILTLHKRFRKMRNERGSKRTGRSAAPSRQGKPTSSSSTRKTPKKTGVAGTKKFTKTANGNSEHKKTTGPKKFGTRFKKEGDKKWEDKNESGSSSKPTFKKKYNSDRKSGLSDKKPYSKSSFADKDASKGEKKFISKGSYKKKFVEDSGDRTEKKSGSFSEYRKKGSGSSFAERKEYKKKTGIKTYTDKSNPDRTYTKETEIVKGKNSHKSFKKVKVYQDADKGSDGSVRLNKYIANAGICSRREADTYIETGVVTVNGVVVTELGFKVKPGDRVLFHDKPIIGEKHVYILLNKPKDYITTSKDPQNRKTVLELINGVKERVFPVGRLDRNTTGVLLLTNDGALAEKLMHPRKGVAKIYHVELDKKFTTPDLEKMRTGLELEDGFFTPDEVDYAEGMDKHHVGIEIHSGANRIVRRLFESLNYNVIKLDRVVYAGLTKKGLTRGKWRFLKDSEVHALKMM